MAQSVQNGTCTKKTPTSFLAEFCAQQKAESPLYEFIPEESNPNVPIFTISATAFGFTSIGVARSKTDARHEASQNLIDILSQCDSFKNKMISRTQPQSQISQSTLTLRNNDAVGSLITFCQHHGFGQPIFPEISVDGRDHTREFKIGCYVGERQCFGVGSTKREARQIAAQTMLKRIEQENDEESSSTSSNCSFKTSESAELRATSLGASIQDLSIRDNQPIDTTCITKLKTLCQQYSMKLPNFEMVSSTGQDHQKEFTFVCKVEKYESRGTSTKKKLAKQIAAMEMISLIEEDGSFGSLVRLDIEDLPSVEEVLADYRRMKNKCVPVATSNLRYRNDFFLKLPREDRSKAEQVLSQDYSDQIQAKKIVYAALAALNLKHEIKRVGRNRAIFTLVEPNFDCVITENNDELFARIIDYLKNMLNMQNVSGALSDVTNQKI